MTLRKFISTSELSKKSGASARRGQSRKRDHQIYIQDHRGQRANPRTRVIQLDGVCVFVCMCVFVAPLRFKAGYYAAWKYTGFFGANRITEFLTVSDECWKERSQKERVEVLLSRLGVEKQFRGAYSGAGNFQCATCFGFRLIVSYVYKRHTLQIGMSRTLQQRAFENINFL